MTDLEKIELAPHRLAERIPSKGDHAPVGYWLKQLAHQIAKDEFERGNRSEPKVQLPPGPREASCVHWPGQKRCGVCGMGGGHERY